MELIYWSVSSSNRRWRDGVVLFTASFTSLENLKIWCNIHVIINPKYYHPCFRIATINSTTLYSAHSSPARWGGRVHRSPPTKHCSPAAKYSSTTGRWSNCCSGSNIFVEVRLVWCFINDFMTQSNYFFILYKKGYLLPRGFDYGLTENYLILYRMQKKIWK